VETAGFYLHKAIFKNQVLQPAEDGQENLITEFASHYNFREP